jgi:hypothetical protein
MVPSSAKLMMASVVEETTADSHSRTSSACLRSVMSMKVKHHAGDAVVHRAVGHQPRQVPAAVGLADLALDRHQPLQHARGVGAQLRVIELRGQVGQRPADVARDQVEQRTAAGV